ncbi:MAG: hypothetical protein F6K26_24680 [Moorea sp. SIO2I5]|nr:hypothetical protein [Moorena sp. SIO2I5]
MALAGHATRCLWRGFADRISRSQSKLFRFFPIPNFLTIPILTQSLILDTTPLHLSPTLSTLTTLSSRFPTPDSRLPDIANFYFSPYTSTIGIVNIQFTDEQVRWNY